MYAWGLIFGVPDLYTTRLTTLSMVGYPGEPEATGGPWDGGGINEFKRCVS